MPWALSRQRRMHDRCGHFEVLFTTMRRIRTTIGTHLYNLQASFVCNLRASTPWCERVKFVAPFHRDENRGLGKAVTQLAGGPVQMTGGGLGNLVSDS